MSTPKVDSTQSLAIEIERLGRARPIAFQSSWAEAGFCFSLLGSMFVAEYFTAGFNILLPALSLDLHIPREAETWPASVLSLVTGAFLLPFGRLADILGGYPLFISGLLWFLIWSVIAGFSSNYIMLIICRAMQGLGPAAFLPSGILLLGRIYRPGPRKNFVFSLYGAFAPVGFFVGIFVAGVSAQLLSWAWFFFIGSIMLAIVTIVSYLTIPRDWEVKGICQAKMDWFGTITVIPALIFIVFALTNGSHALHGWKTPYITIILIIGLCLLALFVYVEGWVADQPLLPRDMFELKGMKALIIALFLQYGAFAIFLFYSSFYIERVLRIDPLLATAWFAPMCVGGLILSIFGGLILHLIPGTILLFISGVCLMVSTLLFAIMPDNPNYWAYVFPDMICATIGIDITYNVANIFMTTIMPKARQGLAGSLINSLLFLGISFFLSIADFIVTRTEERGQKQSYKTVFWFATGCAGVGLIVMFLGIRMGKASSDLTIEEREELMSRVLDSP